MKLFNLIVLALHIAVGSYLLNSSFEFYPIPDVITGFHEVILLAAGVLVLFGGLNFLRTLRPSQRK